MNATLYRVLSCPTCGRQYGLTEDDRREVRCCGNPQPLQPIAPENVRPGSMIRYPNPDQFGESPSRLGHLPYSMLLSLYHRELCISKYIDDDQVVEFGRKLLVSPKIYLAVMAERARPKTELEALQLAVAAEPEDDARRLALADWAQEHNRPDVEQEQRLAVALRHVLAAPDDDAPRLEYADICERFGDTDRAEFIRAQIAVANTRAVLHEKIAELLTTRNNMKWRGSALRRIGDVAYCRGFVSTVVLPTAAWVKNAPLILREQPVKAVLLSTDPSESELARIRERHPRVKFITTGDVARSPANLAPLFNTSSIVSVMAFGTLAYTVAPELIALPPDLQIGLANVGDRMPPARMERGPVPRDVIDRLDQVANPSAEGAPDA